MRDYIILNGQNSNTIDGLLISSLPPISKPLLRAQIEEIDGRDGDIVTPLGYSAYDKTVVIGLYGDFDINEIIAYFNSSGVITFSNEPDKFYNYQIIQQIDFEKLIRFRTAAVVFHVQPFKYSLTEPTKAVEFEHVSGKDRTVTLETTGEPLTDFQIYGNATQDGTPTATGHARIETVTGSNTIAFISGATMREFSLLLEDELVYLSYGNDTYQDYIYKDGDSWYLHKVLGKYNVDTSQITAITSYSNVAYAVIPRPLDSERYGTYQSVPLLCNAALYSYGLPSGWNTAEAVNKIFTQADSTTYWLGFPAGTTLAQMQAALSDTVIYYPLADPQTTLITDSNLIAQLNAILEAETFIGETTITSSYYDYAQPIIFASAKPESFNVTNFGNYTAKPIMTIYGSGNISVSLNNNQIFNITLGDEEYITIDTEQMEAYKDGVLKNRLVTGNYDNFALNVGRNIITFGGDVTSATIEKYSRWL